MSTDLPSLLASIGVTILRQQGNELVGPCPVHFQRTGKQDRHPSWSINERTLKMHCFSCGYAGDLGRLYEDMIGTAVPENLEWEMTKESVLTKVRPQEAPEEQQGPAINEWVMGHYDPVPSNLLEHRYLTREAVDAFGVRFDRKRRCWALPIRMPDGELVGYQFRQKGVEINYPDAVPKSMTLFGLNHQLDENRISLVESPLDAVRLAGVGVPAVSSFGAHVSGEQLRLLSKHYRHVILCLDNDTAGWKSVNRITPLLRQRGCVVSTLDYTHLDGKDPGDVGDDELLYAAWRSGLTFGLLT